MTINFEDFQRVELRIGRILAAEQVEGSDKLVKLQVDFGKKDETEEVLKKQVIAGIGKVYQPAALIGKEVLFVANLEPRTIMGLESQGMILAATDGAGPVLMTPDRPVDAGAALH